MPGPTSARLAQLAAVLWIAGCYSDAKDTSETPITTGGTTTPGVVVGPITGTAGVYVQETDCDVIWDMSGSQCDGCGLGWSVVLAPSADSTCDFGQRASGWFELKDGAAYFKEDYWGAAVYGEGSATWETVGYIYGAYDYSYAYSGSATY